MNDGPQGCCSGERLLTDGHGSVRSTEVQSDPPLREMSLTSCLNPTLQLSIFTLR
jgi:hypothetical protein